MERLQKALARAGIASRRQSEEIILSGRVQVNGATVSELGTKVDSERDEIRVDGRLLRRPEPLAYVMLHKPAGYVSTSRDPEGRPTVLDLVPDSRRLYPAGRLDADSEGLLLLTNDGEVTLRLTHPRYGQRKEYLALVRGALAPADLRCLLDGVDLEGGRAKAARVTALRDAPAGLEAPTGGTWVAITVTEGRKRLVRRMLEVIGHPVQRLIRVQMGPLKLGELASGQWRRLTPSEVSALKRIRLPSASPASDKVEAKVAPPPGVVKRRQLGAVEERGSRSDASRSRGPAPRRPSQDRSKRRRPAKSTDTRR